MTDSSRILTFRELLFADQVESDEDIRAFVGRMKSAGADFIKIFADGHGEFSRQQLVLACAEARARDMRSVVHAASSEAVDVVVEAGCSKVEHGYKVDQATISQMSEKGIFYGPSLDIPVHYGRRKQQQPAAESYQPGDIQRMPRDYRDYVAVFRGALATGVAIVYATDAVAGVHGNNADEFIWRVVDGGQSPTEAMVDATSVSARSLGLDHEIGRIAPGYTADIVAVHGEVLRDIRAVKHVGFVMRDGVVHLYRPSSR